MDTSGVTIDELPEGGEDVAPKRSSVILVPAPPALVKKMPKKKAMPAKPKSIATGEPPSEPKRKKGLHRLRLPIRFRMYRKIMKQQRLLRRPCGSVGRVGRERKDVDEEVNQQMSQKASGSERPPTPRSPASSADIPKKVWVAAVTAAQR